MSRIMLANEVRNRTFHLGNIGEMFIDAAGERQNQMCLLGFQLETKTFEVNTDGDVRVCLLPGPKKGWAGAGLVQPH